MAEFKNILYNTDYENINNRIKFSCTNCLTEFTTNVKTMLNHSESTESLFTDSDRINGETRNKKISTTESVHSRSKYSEINDDDR